jgi:hypothetical protein
MFALVVRFEVRPGHLPAFDELVAQTRADIAIYEPDTLVYTSHERADRPSERSSTRRTAIGRRSWRTRRARTPDDSWSNEGSI